MDLLQAAMLPTSPFPLSPLPLSPLVIAAPHHDFSNGPRTPPASFSGCTPPSPLTGLSASANDLVEDPLNSRRKSGGGSTLQRRLSLSACQAPQLTAVEPFQRGVANTSLHGLLQQDLDLKISVLPDTDRNDESGKQASVNPISVTAMNVLRNNDLGGYTVPTNGLYPYQWNWDSALVAMGWSAFDSGRAWEELDKLFSAQWADGMVPHIVFHRPSPTYFPGPEIWGSQEQPMGSTGITQPPIAATAVRHLLEQQLNATVSNSWSGSAASSPIRLPGEDWDRGSAASSSGNSSSSLGGGGAEMEMQRAALDHARELFPKLMRYHRWFFSARDPEGTGLVATLHPWESGMDNSPAWDAPLAAVPVDNIPPYTRKDLGHVDAAMRPKQAEYDRYLTLVYRFKAAGYDPARLYGLSPFRVADVCTNSLLHRANLDLRWLAIELNQLDAVPEIDAWLARSTAAFDSLWDDQSGIYRSLDQLTGQPLDAATSGGFLPLFARVASEEQAARLASTLDRWLGQVEYGVPSLDPADPRFEGLRYWRGPVWAIVNFMVVDGLRAYGYADLAQRVEVDSRRLIEQAGLYEYFDPMTGQGAGGGNFSWTAAMALAWLGKNDAVPLPQNEAQGVYHQTALLTQAHDPALPSLAGTL